MKIRITAKIPTEHAPQIGAIYKVTRTETRPCGRKGKSKMTVYFVKVNGAETGVLENEMEVVEK